MRHIGKDRAVHESDNKPIYCFTYVHAPFVSFVWRWNNAIYTYKKDIQKTDKNQKNKKAAQQCDAFLLE